MQEIAVDTKCLLQGGRLLETCGRSFQEGKNLLGSAIEGVTDDGVSDGGKMDTNLMGASGFDLNIEQSEMPIARLKSLQNAIV